MTPRYPLWLPLLLGLSLSTNLHAGSISTDTDPDSGLQSWTWHHNGVSLQLVQRLPDQTRAFFLGRGFSAQDADRIAESCVFQTIFRNDGNEPIDYDLNDWRLSGPDGPEPLRTREVWEQDWQQAGIKSGPRIAFRWSLLPTRQHFQPGDYNWGMSSYGLPPGSAFDLSLLISANGNTIHGGIPLILCPEDNDN